MDYESTTKELTESFRRWTTRLRRDRALLSFVMTGALCLVATAALSLVRILQGGYLGINPEISTTVIVAAPFVVAAFAWTRTVDSRRIVHALDRSHGHPDTLLCSYEILLGASAPPRTLIARKHVLREGLHCARTVDFRRAFSLPLRRLTLSPLFGLGCLALVGLIPIPSAALESLRAAPSVLLESDLTLPDRAISLTEEDRALIRELRDLVLQRRAAATPPTSEEARRLKEMDELLAKLDSGRVHGREAGARLMELQSELLALSSTDKANKEKTSMQAAGAKTEAASKSEQSLREEEQKQFEEKLAKAARKTLRDEGIKTEKNKEPGALLKTLARLAAKLAERDPKRAQELLKRFARHLVGTDLSKVLNHKDKLSKSLEEVSRALEKEGLSAKTRRRLRRLKEKVEKKLTRNERRQARATKSQEPQLERLRRQLERPPKAPEQNGTKGQKDQADAGPKGKNKAGGARQGKSANRPGERKGRGGAKATGQNRDAGGSQGAEQSSPSQKLDALAERVERNRSDRAIRSKTKALSRRLRSRARMQAAKRRVQRARAQQGPGSERARRLSRKKKMASAGANSKASSKGGSGKSKGSGVGSGNGGSTEGADGLKRGKRAFEDVRVQSQGKDGTFETVRLRGGGAAASAERPARLGFDPTKAQDEDWEAKIPERYRDTVRSYFEMMSSDSESDAASGLR